MRKYFILSLAVLSVVSGEVVADMKQQKEATISAVKEFVGILKGEMKSAMEKGGPVNAISVCSQKAPGVATTIGKKHKLHIARTSLKLRNPGNKPDDWELAVMKQFEERKARGEPVDKLAHAEVVEKDGRKVFRFMKAIPTAEVCMNCHAAEIRHEVASSIGKLYPADQARGYRVGDIRGAVTVVKAMD